MDTFLSDAISLLKEESERKELKQALKSEHKGLKKQVRGLEQEVERIKQAGGASSPSHPYVKGLINAKEKKKKVKKQLKKLTAGKSIDKIKIKTKKLIKDA